MGELPDQSLVELFRAVRRGRTAEHSILRERILAEVESIAIFPTQAILLWEGCRLQRLKYVVPPELAEKLRGEHLPAVNRSEGNGPVHTAYRIAGGCRFPDWEHDHIYDGNHGKLHATTENRHFTQSAGIVLVPKQVNRLRPANAWLSWFFRGVAFMKFGYDPDRVFCDDVDHYGFERGAPYRVFWSDPAINGCGPETQREPNLVVFYEGPVSPIKKPHGALEGRTVRGSREVDPS